MDLQGYSVAEEFADSRAEKARGCSGSNKVSSSVLVLKYLFILGLLLLNRLTANYFPVHKSKILVRLVPLFKAEVEHSPTNEHICLI